MFSRFDSEDGAPGDRRMSFWEHLEELRRRLKVIFVAYIIAFLLVSIVHVEAAPALGVSCCSVSLEPTNGTANQFFSRMLRDLLPAYVEPIVVAPATPLLIQIKIGLFLAAVVSSPVTAWQVGKFISPALKPREKRMIFRVAAPVAALFLFGVVFAYVVVLPFTLDFLYSIAVSMGVTPFIDVDEFLDFILMFMVGFGLAMEMPVVIYGTTAIGLVDVSFWKHNWRWAMLGIFLFGAFITPDASGITMFLVAIPMIILYFVGYAAAVLHARRTRPKA